ncbi:hypothetical protein HYH02_003996 [Chlamydomonas schloesseri]|uniref:Protein DETOXIFICATION n=1 Tax=Chlamydomonas schloesseri TaxID=2026947 RepID=A0A835WRP6_9CHLO|nr:hypothetical protein HYH02_003996 [Chlamydomonas schloesseri]|eukprot:KAG2451395.1 hypothetical protein HYH02_003996 [Chlamydomonas schloesseri]
MSSALTAPTQRAIFSLSPHGISGPAARLERLWKDVRKISLLAGPILAQYVIAHSSHMIDTSFVGHLENPTLLSAMVLGGSIAMATGYHVMCGLASASETLSGQAAGAKNPAALAATLQRSLAVCTAAAVPVTALWLNAEPMLTALGQSPEIAAGAARYLVLTLPALYSYMVFDCVDKHLLAQGVVAPGVAITAAATALTPLYCWYFVNHLDLGLDGAAYAYVASQLTSTALSLGYLAWRARSTAGSPEAVPLAPTAAALAGWAPYLALAVPATLMACMEGWAVEVLIFLSGQLDNADVAVGVTGLCLQFSTLVWLSAASISSATATRIANALGRGDAAGARRLTYTSLGMAAVSQAAIGLAAFSYREPLVRLMTSSEDVLALAAHVLPVLAICFVFDGQNAVLSSVLRGAGRQWLGAGCNLVGWWGVGVPLAYYLALHTDLGVAGLWGGFATASALQAAVQWAVVLRLDWEGEVGRAAEMLRASEAAAGGGSSSSAAAGATVDVLATEVATGQPSGRKAAKGKKAAAKGRGASGTETDDDDDGPGAAPGLLSGGGGGLVEQHGHGIPAMVARAVSERRRQLHSGSSSSSAVGVSGPAAAVTGRLRAASAGRLAARLL